MLDFWGFCMCVHVHVYVGENETGWRETAVTEFCVRVAEEPFLSSSKSPSLIFQSPAVGLRRADQSGPLLSPHSVTSQHSSSHLPFCKNWLLFLTHSLFMVVIFIRVFPFGHCCPNNLLFSELEIFLFLIHLYKSFLKLRR